MNAGNRFRDLAFDHRYGQVYNRNLPRWYKREPDSRIPIVPSPDHIHLFVAGGEAGRFSAFIPGWGHMSVAVLRSIDGAAPVRAALRRRHLLPLSPRRHTHGATSRSERTRPDRSTIRAAW